MVSQAEILELFGTQFRRFLYENFQSFYQIDEAVTQTGFVRKFLGETSLETGIQESSYAKITYNSAWFNPWFGELQFKLQLSSIADIFAFVGLKSTTALPTYNMTESHIGFIFYNGAVYATSADEYTQQRTYLGPAVSGLNPSNNIIYKISKNTFQTYPLPVKYAYFDKMTTDQLQSMLKRKWSSATVHGANPPEDQDHYFVAYIKNSTGEDKRLLIKHILYAEEYPD